MLYRALPKPDRQQTQLAYRLKYFPRRALSCAAVRLLHPSFFIALTKAQVLELTSPERTHILLRGHDHLIVWEWNNIPTEQEWEKYRDTDYIGIEMRRSPAIPEQKVAVLSFHARPDMYRTEQLNLASNN